MFRMGPYVIYMVNDSLPLAHCHDGPFSFSDDQFAACSSLEDPYACLKRGETCEWRVKNDTVSYTCTCTFDGCKVGHKEIQDERALPT